MYQFSAIVLVGSLSIFIISLFRQRTFFTAGSLFSLTWLLVLLAHKFTVRYYNFDPVPEVSYNLLCLVLLMMFLGFALTQLLIGSVIVYRKALIEHYAFLPAFIHKYFPAVVFVTLTLSFGSLIAAGGTVSFDTLNLYDMRRQHVIEGQQSYITQLALYCYIFVTVFFILFALSDMVTGKPRVKPLLILLIALLPLSFSKGSRLEFVNPLFYYFVAYWLILQYKIRYYFDRKRDLKVIKKLLFKSVPLIIVLAITFAVYGQLRSMTKISELSDNFVVGIMLPITEYVQSSLVSVGTISYWIDENTENLIGRTYFEGLYKVPEKIGLISPDTNKLEVRQAYNKLGWIVYTPGTFIRYLVKDFGMLWAPYAAFVIACLTAFITDKVRLCEERTTILTVCWTSPVVIYRKELIGPEGVGSGSGAAGGTMLTR